MNIEAQVTSDIIYNDDQLTYNWVCSIHRICRLQAKRDPGGRKPSLFLITTTFNGPRLESDGSVALLEVNDSVEHAIRKNERFIQHVFNKTVPHRENPKKRSRYPIFYSAIDLSGTREGRPHLKKTPHSHSICVVPCLSVGRFLSQAARKFSVTSHSLNTLSVQDVHCQSIGDTMDDLYNSVDYLLKFQRSGYSKLLRKDLRSDLISIYGPE